MFECTDEGRLTAYFDVLRYTNELDWRRDSLKIDQLLDFFRKQRVEALCKCVRGS